MTGVADANTSAETVTITASGVDLGGATTNRYNRRFNCNRYYPHSKWNNVAEGGTSTLDVKLSAEPSPSTTVTIATSNAGSVSLSTTTLTFDNVCPGANCWEHKSNCNSHWYRRCKRNFRECYHLSATAPSVTSASSSFDTIENDTKPVFTGSVSVTEGSTSLIAVALSGNPGTARTITIGSSNALAVTASPSTFNFNTTNWNVQSSITDWSDRC